ncbi:MAG: NfeD family protein [Zoogloeaceae bacterium]|nr:NfeD family protein [Zoogloeaceae bacterium]
MILEWWHWAVLGIALILAELLVPAFFVIWFGLGGLFVALVVAIFSSLSLTSQLALWTGASLMMVVVWFKIFRPDRHKTQIGTAAGDVIGEIGLLVTAVGPFQRGKVRFQRPILGAEEWVCMAQTELAPGQRVKVVAVEGSFVTVEGA